MTGYYSILQYVPDAARMEGANVGLLLYVPDAEGATVSVRVDDEALRPKQLFPGHDFAHVVTAADAVLGKVSEYMRLHSGLDGLKSFIAGRAGIIQLTSPRPYDVAMGDSDEMFRTLVLPPVAGPAADGR